MPGTDNHDPLDELAAHLRHSGGAELVDEWEITEVETEQGRRRRSYLAQHWMEAMHRGDSVEFIAAFGRVAGAVDYVGNDYATVLGQDFCWDVRTDRGVLTVYRQRSGGHTVRGGSITFKARLAEYESTAEPVAVLLPGYSVERRGRIEVVGADHLVVRTDHTSHVIPLNLVEGVRRSL